jgi:general secretion pathway protein L
MSWFRRYNGIRLLVIGPRRSNPGVPTFMLAEIFTWWTQQMADLAAPVLHRVKASEPDALLLTAEPHTLRVLRRRAGSLTVVGELQADAGPDALRRLLAGHRREPLVLRLPGQVLTCEATLPVAAQGSLDRVVRYEMDRLTPFAANDVFFSHRILARDRARGALQVEIAVAPRRWVQPLLDRLQAVGVTPIALEAPGQDGAIRRIDIVRTDPARQARRMLAFRLAAGTCVALGLAVVAVPLARQSLALSDTEYRIAELKPRVQQVEDLRRRIASGSAGAERIAAAREHAIAPLQMLGLLTDVLPDDTWLTSVALHERKLVLEGHSAAATRLIAAMASDARLRNPAFAAPVLRAENGGEVFTIQAEFGPGP